MKVFFSLSFFLLGMMLSSNSYGVEQAEQLFNQLTYSHIPIQNTEGTFLGSFFETDAHCFDSDKSIT